MTSNTENHKDERDTDAGFGGFLRSLLSGIPWSENARAEEEFTLEAPASRVMEIHNANGKIRVVGEDRLDIHLQAIKHGRAESAEAAQALVDSIEIETSVTSDIFEIDVVVPRRWNRHGSADLLLHVPRDVEVRASTSNGKVCLQGLRCAVRAHSSNGSVRVDDIEGDIEITTANAKVICGCTKGSLVARSSNGKIQVGDHSGPLDACTSNGLIHANLHELSAEGVTLATSNGRIVLELPDKPNAEVDVRVDNGVIRTDFELGGVGGDNTDAPGRMRGRLGRGGSPIKLRTSNGTISLRETRRDKRSD